MVRRGNITRGLTRVLALVLTVVFALSTLHVHAGAAPADGTAVSVVVGIDGDASGGHAPEPDGRDRAADCPICALLSHLVGTPPSELLLVAASGAVADAIARSSQRAWPLYDHHRPPIAAAV